MYYSVAKRVRLVPLNYFGASGGPEGKPRRAAKSEKTGVRICAGSPLKKIPGNFRNFTFLAPPRALPGPPGAGAKILSF